MSSASTPPLAMTNDFIKLYRHKVPERGMPMFITTI
jgi:hypothetical protein